MADQRLKVMISSNQDELTDLRSVLAEAIRAMGYEPIRFEDLGAMDGSAKEAGLNAVKACDFYIGIFDAKFSQPTSEEYRLASKLGKRIRIYLRNRPEDKREPELQAFLEEIGKERKYDKFESAVDLAERLKSALAVAVAEELRGWPVKMQKVMRGLDGEVSRLLGGVRLRQGSEDGRLSLRVLGTVVYSQKVVAVLDGGWDAGAREGMVFELHDLSGGKDELLAMLRVVQVGEGPGPVVCEVIDVVDSSKFWEDLQKPSKEEVLTPFTIDHYLALDDPDKYKYPELGFQLSLERMRKELRI